MSARIPATFIPLFAVIVLSAQQAQAASVVLYDQDFEAPADYVNDGGDVNIFNTVNENYGGQPAGFSFAQTFTVETLNVSGSERGTGTAAFGTGWSDPSGIGGDYAIGMLSAAQDDRLGLTFDVGTLPFFNVFLAISSIDLSTFGGPFVPADGLAPVFQLTLFDSPAGLPTIGGGTVLDSTAITGRASDRDTFDWTEFSLGLSTVGNTNGNVTLQIDLLTGGYAAFDNLRIEADTAPPPVPPVPVPPALALLLGGLGLLAGIGKNLRPVKLP